MTKCLKCGSNLTKRDFFCVHCGIPQQKTCPVCGRQSLLEDLFCGKCGFNYAQVHDVKQQEDLIDSNWQSFVLMQDCISDPDVIKLALEKSEYYLTKFLTEESISSLLNNIYTFEDDDSWTHLVGALSKVKMTRSIIEKCTTTFRILWRPNSDDFVLHIDDSTEIEIRDFDDWDWLRSQASTKIQELNQDTYIPQKLQSAYLQNLWFARNIKNPSKEIINALINAHWKEGDVDDEQVAPKESFIYTMSSYFFCGKWNPDFFDWQERYMYMTRHSKTYFQICNDGISFKATIGYSTEQQKWALIYDYSEGHTYQVSHHTWDYDEEGIYTIYINEYNSYYSQTLNHPRKVIPLDDFEDWEWLYQQAAKQSAEFLKYIPEPSKMVIENACETNLSLAVTILLERGIKVNETAMHEYLKKHENGLELFRSYGYEIAEEHLEAVVRKFPHLIKYISEPSETVVENACKTNISIAVPILLERGFKVNETAMHEYLEKHENGLELFRAHGYEIAEKHLEAAIRKFPHLIAGEEQTEKLQRIAVHSNIYSIKFIKTPCKSVVDEICYKEAFVLEELLNTSASLSLENIRDVATRNQDALKLLRAHGYQIPMEIVELAIATFPELIDEEEFQPEKLQNIAVSANPSAFQWIRNPADSTLKIAIEKEFKLVFKMLKNNVRMGEGSLSAALAQDEDSLVGQLYKHGYDLSQELLEIAIKKNPKCISQIPNPSQELQEQAVKANPFTIAFLQNPDLEIQLTAVLGNPKSIGHIINPAPKIQLAAVRVDADNVKLIRGNIDNSVLDYLLEQDPKNILDLTTSYHKQIPEEYQKAAYDKLKRK